MTPQAGQDGDIQSTKAKEGHCKGEVLSSSAMSCCSAPSSLNSSSTAPLHGLCGVLTITHHQGNSVCVPRTLRSQRTAYLPRPNIRAEFKPTKTPAKGWEVQSDCTVKGHGIRNWMGLGSPSSGHILRNSK